MLLTSPPTLSDFSDVASIHDKNHDKQDNHINGVHGVIHARASSGSKRAIVISDGEPLNP